MIEAVQLLDTNSSIKEVEEFIEGKKVKGDFITGEKFYEYCEMVRNAGGRFIKTLEGNMKAEFGDWIIMGVKGEFYPCKPDIFDATYESMADEEEAIAKRSEAVTQNYWARQDARETGAMAWQKDQAESKQIMKA